MVDVGIHKVFNLLAVHPLQHTKTSNIKWLGIMRGVRRQFKSYNVVGLAIVLEFDQFVTLMPVQNQYLIWALCARSSMFVKVF